MSESGHPTKYTGAGDVSGGAGRVDRVFILVAGAGAPALATIKEGGTGGTVVLELAALAGDTGHPIEASIDSPFLSAISGAGASLIVLQ